MMAKKKLSPETQLLLASERIVDLAAIIANTRRPNTTGPRVDNAAARTIVAGVIAQIIPTLSDQLTAVRAVGAEVGVIEPEATS